MTRWISLALLSLAACSTMPPVPAVPPWNEVQGPVVIDDDERALWAEARQDRAELDTRRLIVSAPGLDAYLASVLGALLPAPLPDGVPKPSVSVVRHAGRLAGTLPDGQILVTTSMLAAVQNEAQLAALLGHELGHFMGRHQLVQARFARTSRSTVERMRLSRDHETYCDRYALAALRRAGYDTRELPRMLALSQDDDHDTPPAAQPFRSHPFIHERIKNLNGAIGDVPDGTARVGTHEYEDAIAGVLPIAAEMELQSRALDQAKQSIARLLALRPESGHGYYLRGEHARLTERDGRRAPAVRGAYERAVELAPEDPDALRALGLLYQEEGNASGARPLLQKYLTLVPDASDRKLVERYLGSENR